MSVCYIVVIFSLCIHVLCECVFIIMDCSCPNSGIEMENRYIEDDKPAPQSVSTVHTCTCSNHIILK